MNMACTDAKPGGLVYVPLPDADYSDDSKAYREKVVLKHSGASTANRQSSTAEDAESGILQCCAKCAKLLLMKMVCVQGCMHCCARAFSLDFCFYRRVIVYAL